MTVDLTSFINPLLGLALAAFTAAVPIVTAAVLKRLGVANNASLAASLTTAADAAAGEAYRFALAHDGGLSSVAVHNAALAAGATYVTDRMPDAMTQLGLTPDNVQAMVAARLGALLATDPTVTAGRPATQQPLGVPAPVAPALPAVAVPAA